MARYNHVALADSFSLAEAANHLFLLRAMEGEFAPVGALAIHFVGRAPKHPSRRHLPKLGDDVAPDVLDETALAEDAFAKVAHELGAEWLELAAAILRESTDGRPHSRKSVVTPDVNRRLPEFVAGSHLVAGEDYAARRGLLETTVKLLSVAAQELARDPGEDVLDMDFLIRAAASRTLTRKRGNEEFSRLDRMHRRAFVALQEAQREIEQIERDLFEARVEELDLVMVGVDDADGQVYRCGKAKARVLWARSNERGFVSVARKVTDADLVVQFRKSDCRVLVVLDDHLSAVAPDGRRLGGLAHVAAMLRNADAVVRKGSKPTESATVCAPGLVAPPGDGQVAVFRMAGSGNVVGNFDPELPRSALRSDRLERLIRLVMTTGCLEDLFGRPVPTMAWELAEVCMPEEE